MSVTILQLTPGDPIIARDGRPFGAGQGNRMHGIAWPLPSVVAGSFRTALVKSRADLDFTKTMPRQLMAIKVAGVFPTVDRLLYLPAPNDCVWDEKTGKVFRVQPVPLEDGEGVDFPLDGLLPVRLTRGKPKTISRENPSRPGGRGISTISGCRRPRSSFLPTGSTRNFWTPQFRKSRDNVCLDAQTGAAGEGQLFTTAGLNVTYLPRHAVAASEPFQARFAPNTLSVRVICGDEGLGNMDQLTWHPLGGERRLVHWRVNPDTAQGWTCPQAVTQALKSARRIRMVLATPAIFSHGWRPGWLDAETLTGTLWDDGPTLKLVGVSNGRWKAVSGWSLARINSKGELDPGGRPGAKPIRRMVPAGSVYFFEKIAGDNTALTTHGWLGPVSDAPQDCNDGFGLAAWGTW